MKKIILSLFVVLSAVFTLPAYAGAAGTVIGNACTDVDSSLCTNLKNDKALINIVKTIVDWLMIILGSVSVIVIVISGIQFVLSAGNPSSITKAKNTLIYAIIGLTVAILATAIVNFIWTTFGK